jgi:hypothetical protein
LRLHNKLNSEKSTFGNLFDKKKSGGVKEPPKFSLNMSNRKKEIVRISEENLRIVQRLQDIKGEVIVKKKRTKSQSDKSMSRGIGTAPSISMSTFYRRKMSRASGRQLLDQL